jgi:hypothetical protein
MSDPHRQPIDPQRWLEFIRERLSVGSSVEWEYAATGFVQGVFGDGLELRPVVILKRFSESEDLVVGCRIRQFDSRGELESVCLLSYDDLLFLLKMSQANRPCDAASPKVPVRSSFTTRSGFTFEWSEQSWLPTVAVNAACSRQVNLTAAEFARFRQLWSRCLDFLDGLVA